MEEFSIKGNGDFLKISFDKVYGFPEETCSWGGYDLETTLEIKSRGFMVKAKLYTSTGEIYEFYEQLKLRNDQLNGDVYYRTYEGNLDLKLAYDNLGHVKVAGKFSEQNEFANELEFEFDSDQTFIKATLNELKEIAAQYGDLKGVKNTFN